MGMWIYFSTINFMKYRSSISNENLASELKYVVNIKYRSDFKYLVKKSVQKIWILFILIKCWNYNILDIGLNKIYY